MIIVPLPPALQENDTRFLAFLTHWTSIHWSEAGQPNPECVTECQWWHSVPSSSLLIKGSSYSCTCNVYSSIAWFYVLSMSKHLILTLFSLQLWLWIKSMLLIRTPVNSMAIAEVVMQIPAMGNVCGHLLATLLGCRLMFRFFKEKGRTTAEYLTGIRHRHRIVFLFLPSVAA